MKLILLLCTLSIISFNSFSQLCQYDIKLKSVQLKKDLDKFKPLSRESELFIFLTNNDKGKNASGNYVKYFLDISNEDARNKKLISLNMPSYQFESSQDTIKNISLIIREFEDYVPSTFTDFAETMGLTRRGYVLHMHLSLSRSFIWERVSKDNSGIIISKRTLAYENDIIKTNLLATKTCNDVDKTLWRTVTKSHFYFNFRNTPVGDFLNRPYCILRYEYKDALSQAMKTGRLVITDPDDFEEMGRNTALLKLRSNYKDEIMLYVSRSSDQEKVSFNIELSSKFSNDSQVTTVTRETLKGLNIKLPKVSLKCTR